MWYRIRQRIWKWLRKDPRIIETPLYRRRGHHVILKGAYKPLAKDFTPSVTLPTNGHVSQE